MANIDSEKLLKQIERIDPYYYDPVQLKWKILGIVKEMKKSSNSISIPEDATKGDIFTLAFPNEKYLTPDNNSYLENEIIIQSTTLGISEAAKIDKLWWDSKYKE